MLESHSQVMAIKLCLADGRPVCRQLAVQQARFPGVTVVGGRPVVRCRRVSVGLAVDEVSETGFVGWPVPGKKSQQGDCVTSLTRTNVPMLY